MNTGLKMRGLSLSCFDTANIPGKYVYPDDSTAGEQAAEALNQGKPVMFYGNYKASGNYHAVVLLGADSDGSILIYNPGPGKIENYGSSSSFGKNMDEFFATYFQHWIYIPDEVPTGVKRKDDQNLYVGYKGNEEVVSPVTGILLEYGTYDNSENQKNERTNVDLKYGNSLLDTKEGKEVVDKVGYAKIMVLDAENYRKLEVNTGSYWASSDKSLVNKNPSDKSKNMYVNDSDLKSVEDLDDDRWNETNTTVYGYKEFAEKYEMGGISGNIIYIDGFICQDIDENLGEDDVEAQIPEGNPIVKEDFMKTDLKDKDSLRKSLYSSDANYKSVSKEETELIKVENKIKKNAASAFTINDNGKDIIFIKEGTILGRTMTDKELLEASYLRDGKYGTYDELRNPEDKDKKEVIGNYLRMIFRDEDDSVIENVEDYIELEKPKPTIGEELARFALSICCSAVNTDYVTQSDLNAAGYSGLLVVNSPPDGRIHMTEALAIPTEMEEGGSANHNPHYRIEHLEQAKAFNEWQDKYCIKYGYQNANWYASCSPWVAGAVRTLEIDNNMPIAAKNQSNYCLEHTDIYQVIPMDPSKSYDDQCQPGDIINWSQHTMMYVGNDLAQEYFPGTTANICEAGEFGMNHLGATEWSGNPGADFNILRVR